MFWTAVIIVDCLLFDADPEYRFFAASISGSCCDLNRMSPSFLFGGNDTFAVYRRPFFL